MLWDPLPKQSQNKRPCVAVKSQWSPPKFSPDDRFVQDIIERTREYNVLPEHEQREHAERIEEREEDIRQVQERMVIVNADVQEARLD